MKIVSAIVTGIFLISVFPLFAELKIHEKGNIEIGGIPVRLTCFDEQWRRTAQLDRAFIVKKRDGTALESEFDTPSLKGPRTG